MSENVQVVVRVRPFLRTEEAVGCVKTMAGNQVLVGESRCFGFDRVLGMESSSADVYRTVGVALSDTFYDGVNVAVIAYGQTGAGKTHTMSHLSNDLLHHVFERMQVNHETLGTGGLSMKLTVVEVYNESLGDLLAAENRGGAPLYPNAGPLQQREMPKGAGVHIPGLQEVEVFSEEELHRHIDKATANRKTASTLLNATSSRSHCVVTVTLTRHGVISKCSLVDLAGSERLKKSLGFNMGSSGPEHPFYSRPGDRDGEDTVVMERAREGININGGLLALGNVIVALCERRQHIPFRSSKLTRLLQPVLSGNCRTTMVACISPLSSSFEETLNTLKYADRAKSIKTHPHLVVTANVEEAESVILGLRKEVEELQRQLQSTVTPEQSSAGPVNRLPSGRPPLIPRSPAGGSSLDTSRRFLETQALLVIEKKESKRLEDELFHAEYTAMVETEKRKSLEERVVELEGLLVTEQEQRSSLEMSNGRLEEQLRESRSAMASPTVTSILQPASHTGAAQDLLEKAHQEHLRKIEALEAEKQELESEKKELEAEVARLTRELAAHQGQEAAEPVSTRTSAADEALQDILRNVRSGATLSAVQPKLEALQKMIKALGHGKERDGYGTAPPLSSEAAALQLQLQERLQDMDAVSARLQLKREEIEAAKQQQTASSRSKFFSSSRKPDAGAKPLSRKRRGAGVVVSDELHGMGERSSIGADGGPIQHAAQAAIEEELKVLEDLEREIKELETYKGSLNAARLTDEHKWPQAIKGYRKRLGTVMALLHQPATQSVSDPLSPDRVASLEAEQQSLESRLRKVEVYQVVVDQAKLQLDEVDRRIESLNDTLKFHLHRVLRLQNPARAEDALDTSRDSGSYALPSVREISTSRGRWHHRHLGVSPLDTPRKYLSTEAPSSVETQPAASRASIEQLEETIAIQNAKIKALEAQLGT